MRLRLEIEEGGVKRLRFDLGVFIFVLYPVSTIHRIRYYILNCCPMQSIFYLILSYPTIKHSLSD